MSKKIHVRPGKGQSKAGFGVGIVFCLIGLFVVIPIFGPFGILWTAGAGWITYVHYKNGFTNEPIDSHVIDIRGIVKLDKFSDEDVLKFVLGRQ